MVDCFSYLRSTRLLACWPSFTPFRLDPRALKIAVASEAARGDERFNANYGGGVLNGRAPRLAVLQR